MKFTSAFLCLIILFPVRADFEANQLDALKKVANKLIVQQQEPYFPSSTYTLLKHLPEKSRVDFKQGVKAQTTLNGNELLLIKKMINQLILGSLSQQKQAVELSYTIAQANTVLLQEEQNELNTQFAKAYFSIHEKDAVDFNSKNIYQRRQIQDKINDYLISTFLNNPSDNVPLALLQVSKILGLDNVKSQVAYLLSIYNLPVSQNIKLSTKQFIDFIDIMIPNLLKSSIAEERIIAYLLDDLRKIWKKELKYNHKDHDILTAKELVKNLKLGAGIYFPLLTPRSINTLAINDSNTGHNIFIRSHVKKINTVSSVKPVNPEVESLAKQGSVILEELIKNSSLPHFELKLSSPKDRILKGSSATLSLAVLMSSYIDNFILDSSLTYTGHLSENQVKYVRGIPAKLMGAHKSGKLNIVIPKVNFSEVNDLALLHGYDTLEELQIFGVSTLQEALDISRLYKKANIKDAIVQFTQLSKMPKERELLNILKLYPNHLSAKILLNKIQKKNNKLSFGTSVEEIKTLTHRVLSQQSTNDEIAAVLQKLKGLEPLLHQDSLILVDKVRVFLKALLESKDLKKARLELIKIGDEIDLKIKEYYKTKAKL